MATHVENVIIGTPIVDPCEIFAKDSEDWEQFEKEKTIWTEERNLAVILKELGIVKSVSEVRRNKPHFCVQLNTLDFMEVKWGKTKLFILVGE